MVKRRIKDIYDDRQLVLINGGLGSKSSQLERGVRKTDVSALINVLPYYAFTEDGMKNNFRSTPPPRQTHLSRNYYFLQSAYFGLLNMESVNGQYEFPHEMLTQMHPAEILAVCSGAYRSKFKETIPKEIRFFPLEIPKKVKYIDDYIINAFNYALDKDKGVHGLREFYHKHHPELHSTPLRERLKKVSDSAKLKFLESLSKSLIDINSKVPNYAYKLGDPHPENIADSVGIDIYGAHIYKFLRILYFRKPWQAGSS